MPGKAAPPPPIETPLVLQRLSCRGKTFLDHPVTVTAEDSSIDDYGYAQRPDREVACSADDDAFPDERGGAFGVHDGSDSDGDGGGGDYHATFADRKHSTATDKRHARHTAQPGADVQAPAVVARGMPPSNFKCACCGDESGYTLQLPWNVFKTAYRAKGAAHAVECVVAMATMLERKQMTAVLKRVAVCKKVECMIAMDMRDANEYAQWIETAKQRPQAELGTPRKGQSAAFRKNIDLLRFMYSDKRGERVLSASKVSALFEYVVLNSQQVQENEKRFIATAMAIVENPVHFPFVFPQPQTLVDRIARLPRNYALNVVLPHILDTELDDFRWNSKYKRVLETAAPKASDAIFAAMCDINSEANGREREDGRLVHRLAPEASDACRAVFTPDGFKAALAQAVKASPEYTMSYAGGSLALNSVGGKNGLGKGAPRYQQYELLRILAGSERKGKAVGKGAVAAPTCGSRQADSGVHTHERYVAVFLAEGLSLAEAVDRTAIFVEHHKAGNLVGKEKLGKGQEKAKACHTLRKLGDPITFKYSAASAPARATKMRLAHTALTALTPLGKKPRR
jgi:hypothetical protein